MLLPFASRPIVASSSGESKAGLTGVGPHPESGADPRVGIFGGTFDPPHAGHAIVAREVVEALGLNRLLWVPAATPPHKTGRALTPPGVRRRLVEAAIESDPRFELCDLELERGGVSYTIDTLRRLRADHPRWSLYLVVGMDLLAGFARWKESAAIPELAEVVVIARAGVPEEVALAAVRDPALPDGRVRFVQVTPVDISSARVRSRLAGNLAVRGMVTPAVRAVIEREGLYRA